MRGVVTNVIRKGQHVKDQGGYFFIKGEDGEDYFAHARDLEDRKGTPDIRLFELLVTRFSRHQRTEVAFEVSKVTKTGKGNGLSAVHVRVA